MLVVVAVVALAMPPLIWRYGDDLKFGIRYFRIMVLNRRELDRLVDPIAPVHQINLVNEFSRAIRAGRFNEARSMTTANFQRREEPAAFQKLLEASPLGRWSLSKVLEVSCNFSDDRGQFVYTYLLCCGTEPPANVCLIVVTEGGQLKVDQIESIR